MVVTLNDLRVRFYPKRLLSTKLLCLPWPMTGSSAALDSHPPGRIIAESELIGFTVIWCGHQSTGNEACSAGVRTV